SSSARAAPTASPSAFQKSGSRTDRQRYGACVVAVTSMWYCASLAVSTPLQRRYTSVALIGRASSVSVSANTFDSCFIFIPLRTRHRATAAATLCILTPSQGLVQSYLNHPFSDNRHDFRRVDDGVSFNTGTGSVRQLPANLFGSFLRRGASLPG